MDTLAPAPKTPAPQKNRQLKLECPECGYTARATAKWIAVGMPTCPCGGEFARA